MRTFDGCHDVIRRNESARQFRGDPSLGFCTTGSFARTANAEGPLEFGAEQAVRELMQRDESGCHVLTLIKDDRYEWIFHTSRLWTLENIVDAFETSIDLNRFSCASEFDPGWTKFLNYC